MFDTCISASHRFATPNSSRASDYLQQLTSWRLRQEREENAPTPLTLSPVPNKVRHPLQLNGSFLLSARRVMPAKVSVT